LEVNEVVKVLNCDEFVDKAPKAIFNKLLDRGDYHCSVRTMYRILNAQGAVAERRQVARNRSFATPELLATGPNQVWSWDISKLRVSAKWSSPVESARLEELTAQFRAGEKNIRGPIARAIQLA
jgi:hypothetical protein